MTISNFSNLSFRRIRVDDAELLSQFFIKNQAHFKPWEPHREHGYHAVSSWQSRIKQYEEEYKLSSSAHFVAYETTHHSIIAFCSLTNIIHGPFKACYMGYGVDKEHQGKAVMHALCQYVLDIAFNEFGLNRVMANYVPSNKRSGKLLTKLGFEQEGLAKRYLKIDGLWQDHVLTAKLNPVSV